MFSFLTKRKHCLALYAHVGIVSLFWVQTGLWIILKFLELSKVIWVVLFLHSVFYCPSLSFLHYYSSQMYSFLNSYHTYNLTPHIKRYPQIKTHMKNISMWFFNYQGLFGNRHLRRELTTFFSLLITVTGLRYSLQVT